MVATVSGLSERGVMRIKEGFVLREVAGQAVVIATGEASKGFHGMIRLNETGRVIWEGLAAGKSNEEIAADLVSAYEVGDEKATADVAAFVKQAAEEGFLA